jgi:hypothetical protein
LESALRLRRSISLPKAYKENKLNGEIRGRCYDNNFRRFLPIFGEKTGVFLKYQCYDQLFSKFSFVLSQKSQFFANFFAKIFKKSYVTSVSGPEARSQSYDRDLQRQRCKNLQRRK